ncbi:hypothetical protein QJS10_CPA01g02734 [Acorus calamus]|uniref:Bifunctional inhibitor/plant lipid transfer protein/seed storage helical domain-containing protein n=1 Tax=Acorus calamus TaxID=4465 RepID=A0AAV9FJ82_ACOCL|nr:hypothetical protein QJS10_CPA01g02734 [Acorus calamus]
MVLPKALASTALLLSLNLLCFSLVSSHPYIIPTLPTNPSPAHKSPAVNPHAACHAVTLKLGGCSDLLNNIGGLGNAIHVGSGGLGLGNVVGLGNGILGSGGSSCCSTLKSLPKVDAAVCLCLALKSNVLGSNLDILKSLGSVLSGCGCAIPAGFICN